MVLRKSALVLLLSLVTQNVQAYIPAVPTNSTETAIEGGLNLTETSKLNMQWFQRGQNVSYRLRGNDSNGISKGALVHFSEERVTNSTPGTNTPWIAMVLCDRNASDASMDIDIFTMARDKGAVGALLYTVDSLACVINPEYADHSLFDQVFDIFSTQSKTSASLIEYQFGQLLNDSTPTGSPGRNANKTVDVILDYDSKKLNDSYDAVMDSIAQGYALSPGFLLATMQAFNATVEDTTPSTNGGDSHATANENQNSSNTALAMIVLYAITGCVSALFCVVIITGAIRAIRHPERYGPRPRGPDGMQQSRARGLTRAILDTFPIVKFGNLSSALDPNANRPPKDVESSGGPLELSLTRTSLQLVDALKPPSLIPAEDDKAKDIASCKHTHDSKNDNDVPIDAPTHEASSSTTPPVTRRPPKSEPENATAGSSDIRHDVVPDSIGRETCPICIVDFEEGDDVRVLPCEGKHCFHQTCVDPWLLELSSSCPICRQDFFALENIISGRTEDGHGNPDGAQQDVSQHPQGHNEHHGLNRFSRYVRFAIGRRHRRHDEPDPTDPYMPQAPETSIYSAM
ncbi:hypothetical protein NMY22_g4840 [Coprinellus aureogranulatus]|nr:hypothetical protein NMY22_g4840 [Coprinellus aureogranulatus]